MIRKVIEITEDRRQIAQALRALRQAAGLSQVEVAKRARMSQPKVSALEGGRSIGMRSIQRIVKGIGGRASLVFDFPRAASDGITPDRPPRLAKLRKEGKLRSRLR